jgi:hypothetical protein
MSWYKFARDYTSEYNQHNLAQFFEEEAKSKSTNSQSVPQMEMQEKKPGEINLEDALDPERVNVVKDPKQYNEIRMPNRYFGHGQGQDGIMQTNKDLAIYGGDVFTLTTDFNTN